MNIINKIDKYFEQLDEAIPLSTMYKIVNIKTNIIEFEGSKKLMDKKIKELNKGDKKYYMGIGGTGKNIGQKFGGTYRSGADILKDLKAHRAKFGGDTGTDADFEGPYKEGSREVEESQYPFAPSGESNVAEDKGEAFLVVDNPRNRVNAPELVGVTFENPPSYMQVKPVKGPAHFKNHQDFLDKKGRKTVKETFKSHLAKRGPADLKAGLETAVTPDGQM